MWAGYSAKYGPPTESDAWVDIDGHDDDDGEDASAAGEPGVLPVDGFVVGAQNESVGLGVIPAQPRSKANTFAIHPYTLDGTGGAEFNLRPDVTLAKTIAVLQQYAKEPPGMSRRVQHHAMSQRSRRPSRGIGAARRTTNPDSVLLATRRGSAQRANISRPGASAIDPRFRAMLGGSEDDRESGAISGIRATDTDDEDSTPPPMSSYRANRLARELNNYSSILDETEADDMAQGMDEDFEDVDEEEDEDEDDFGGAFARPRWPLGYGEQAELERFQRSRQSSKDPASSGLVVQAEDGLEELDTISTDKTAVAPPQSFSATHSTTKLLTPEHLQSDLVDTLECQLCYMLLYQPLTTPCGHTFCRVCFARSLDHSSNCPLCRASMPSFSFFHNHPLNQGLVSILNSHLGAPDEETRKPVNDDGSPRSSTDYPEEELLSMSQLGVFADSHRLPLDSGYDAKSRAQEDVEDISFGLRHLYHERAETVKREEEALAHWVPIFVCTLAFPGMPTNLHIFEPRYRLMVRRCLQSNGPSRFGMVLPSPQVNSRTPGLAEYGTMLDIKSCQMLLDGRSMLETVGWRRFRLLETSSLDGYMTGRIEYIDDDVLQVQAAEEAAVLQANAESSRRNLSQQRRVQGTQEIGDRATADEDAMMTDLESSSEPSAANAATRDAHARVEASAGSQGGSSPSLVLPPLGDDGTRPEQPTSPELIKTCVDFIEMLRTDTAPGLFDQIVATYGPVPHALETDKLGWWLGMVLPIDEIAKSTLLPIRSPRRRLEMIVSWIDRIQSQWRLQA